MAHNRSPSKIRADVLGSPLSIYSGWFLEVDGRFLLDWSGWWIDKQLHLSIRPRAGALPDRPGCSRLIRQPPLFDDAVHEG